MEMKCRAYIKETGEIKQVTSIEFDCERIHTGMYEFYYFDQVELMWYTGLKDKNEVEIYEGDIIDRNEQYQEVVAFRNGDFTLDYSYAYGRQEGTDYCNLGFYVTERKCCTVIGNIYQNHELLGV